MFPYLYSLLWVAAAFSGGLCAIEASQRLLHEIAKNPCTAELKNVKLDYTLSGAGFHRKATVSVDLKRATLESVLHHHTATTANSTQLLYSVGFLFHVIKDIYFDLDELATQVESGTIKGDVVYFEHIDTELPASTAGEHVLLAYEKLDNCTAEWCHVQISIPVHLRYQPAHSHHHYHTFPLPPPYLLLTSNQHTQDHTSLLNSSASSVSLPCTAHSERQCVWVCARPDKTWCTDGQECAADISVMVPCGVLYWRWVVTIVTAGVVGGGSVVLAWCISTR